MMNKFIITTLLLIANAWAFGQEEYQSLFWKISGNGLEKPSYLYGTMHVQDQRIFNFKDGVMKAFNEAEIYAMELNMDSINPLELQKKLVMDSTHSLKTLLSKDEYILVEDYFRDSLKQPLFLFNKMQPLFTTQLVTAKDLGTEQKEALDIYFFNKAKKQDKVTIGLETMEEQVDAFSSIPYHKQAEGLVEAVKKGMTLDTTETSMDDLVEYYVKEDLDKLLEISTESEDDPEVSKIFNETFLIDRNQKMANRSIQYLTKGSTFIAIGAAHLPGDQGVIQLLRGKGYTVEAK